MSLTGRITSIEADNVYRDASGDRAMTVTVQVVGSNWTMTIERIDPESVPTAGGRATVTEISGRVVIRPLIPDEASTPPAAHRTAAPLMTKTELARALRVTTRTIDRHVHDGLPFVRVGRRRRFDHAAVLAWMYKQGRDL